MKIFLYSIFLICCNSAILKADDNLSSCEKPEHQKKQSDAKTKLRVMTFNIRYDNPRDGKNQWKHRKEMVTDMVLKNQVDLFGMQEVTHGQLKYLQKNLPTFSSFGVARDDGRTKGEYSPIFYNKKRFELLKQSTFWLSTTPDKIGSIGWDAALPRVATWGKFRDKQTGKTFVLFNTHFDHRGSKARHQSALLIHQKTKAIAKELPVMVMGDFNAVLKSKPYLTLHNAIISDGSAIRDSRTISKTKPTGPSSTFNGFRATVPNKLIDHIFVSSSFNVNSHAIIDKKVNDRFPSDHYPVLIETEFKK